MTTRELRDILNLLIRSDDHGKVRLKIKYKDRAFVMDILRPEYIDDGNGNLNILVDFEQIEQLEMENVRG